MNFVEYTWVCVTLSILTAVLQAGIVLLLINRKIKSDFPIFLAYCTYAAFVGIVLSVAYAVPRLASYDRYVYLYAVLNVLGMILEFGVMYELVVAALKPYNAIIDLGKMLFRWAGLFLLLAVTLTAFATAGSLATQCNAGIDLLAKSLRLMQCGLLLLFFLFERRLSLSWRSRPVTLALGLGVSAAIALMCSYLRTRYIVWGLWLNVAEVGSYFLVVAFWTTSFAQREPQRKSVLDSPSRLIFQRWNEALSGYGYGSAPSTVESFLPGIEKTVDRVMARRVS